MRRSITAASVAAAPLDPESPTVKQLLWYFNDPVHPSNTCFGFFLTAECLFGKLALIFVL